MDYSFRFPVIRGKQANREYYVAMVPMKMIPRLFPADDEFIAPEYRAQRRLNESRVPVISRYVLENRDSYVFSALAASIDGTHGFIPDEGNPDAGVLEVSMDARFLINDGQHRKAAILAALNEDPTLEDETISIVFYADEGLRRSQQIFTDLNKNAVKTSNSISELYDSRDSLAVANRNVIMSNEFLNAYTDKEKDILGKYSSNLFTLHTFYVANRYVLGTRKAKEKDEEFLVNYWQSVSAHIVPWQDLIERRINKKELRENYIATQGVVIQALGKLGNYFYVNRDCELDEYLKNLERVNWKRDNSKWYLRAIRSNGRIITNQKAVQLIANYLKEQTGIPLNSEEQKAERQLQFEIKEQRRTR